MSNYPWAVNRWKLERAIKAAKDKGSLTEDTVKEEYVKLKGLVREEEVEEEKPKTKVKK